MADTKKPKLITEITIDPDKQITLTGEMPAVKLEERVLKTTIRPEDVVYKNLGKLVYLGNENIEETYTALLALMKDYDGRIVGDDRYGLVDKAVSQYFELEHDASIVEFDEAKQPYSRSKRNAGSQGLSRIYTATPDEKVEQFTIVKAGLNGQLYQLLLEGRHHKEISEQTDAIPELLDYTILMLSDGSVFSVMRMQNFEGPSLEDYLANKDVTMLDKIKAIRDVAVQVDNIHATGYVHRDLKPSNVIMTKDGARIIDMGTVHKIGDKIRNEQALGTVAYMAPEHVENKVDVRMDIYSICSILYEAITGQVPHADAIAGANPNTPQYLAELSKAMYDSMQQEKHIKDMPEDRRKKLEAVNADLYQVIVQNLRSNPDQRMHGNCYALANTLSYIISNMETVLSARVNADQLALEAFEQDVETHIGKAGRTIDPSHYAPTTPEEAEIAKSGIGYLVTDNTLPTRGSEADQTVYPRPTTVGPWKRS